MNLNYKGNRWFKCDLHLHTPASKCFYDQAVTPEQWVERALEQGLDCVAVTDHNTGDWIDKVKAAAEGTGITVFPGVEITCDTSKVHLLVIFDNSKTSQDINDFLILCGIRRDMFAEQSASSPLQIFAIALKAHEQGAIVIPAHIDEYNGLESISYDNLKHFYSLKYINAVQVVHKEFLSTNLVVNNNEELKASLNSYYAQPVPPIDYTTMVNWYRTVKLAIEHNLAITTFSDNPHEPKNSKHGLNGIGTRYTWIKMDETPSLEGLRQAFLLPAFRIKNDFEIEKAPYTTPDLWIKSITVANTNITDANPLTIDFSPQLTAMIGGRGSGKSSILRFIRGLFNRVSDLSDLHDILKDHNEFYKLTDSRSKKGVFNDGSVIVIEFIRNKILHKITASNIKNSDNQEIKIEKQNPHDKTWILEEAHGYIDFFQFEQYSQKQIFEIAQEPNSLRERIDNSVQAIQDLKDQREYIKNSFFETCASIRTIQHQVSGKGKLQTEIKDLDDSIKLFQESGIASLLTEKEKFKSQSNTIDEFASQASAKEVQLEELITAFELPLFSDENFKTEHKEELNLLSDNLVKEFSDIKNTLEELKKKAVDAQRIFTDSLQKTVWKKDFDNNVKDFNDKKQELEEQGIDDILKFEEYTEAKETKEKNLEAILEEELNLEKEQVQKNTLQQKYLALTKEITRKRKEYVERILKDEKVKVTISPFRNKIDFVNKLRTIIQKFNTHDSDIEALTSICFNGNVEQCILNVRKIFTDIRKGEQNSSVSGYFVNVIKSLSDSQLDEIELLWPEDEIEIQYKPTGSASFRPLSTASAGQKTTAILTLILSQGNIPLLLDQPEDDLDNRLVYELIVDRLKQAKEHRQIIVVTHNANIPVNGDAEYILSLNSETNKLSIFCSGTVENVRVKKEICDVMEGTEQAFDMRSRRYKQNFI